MNKIPINLVEIYYATLSGLTGGMKQFGIFSYDKYYHMAEGDWYIYYMALAFTEHLN